MARDSWLEGLTRIMAIRTKFQRRDDEAQGIEPELGEGANKSQSVAKWPGGPAKL